MANYKASRPYFLAILCRLQRKSPIVEIMSRSAHSPCLQVSSNFSCKLRFRRGRSRGILGSMTVQNLSDQLPFTTKDGSTIRSILDRTNAPVQQQSLAEARVPAGCRTTRHYHKLSEEFYFILEGAGEIELDGEHRTVGPGDAVLIPSGVSHTITATEPLRFLCCCAPPYAHEDTYFE